jgi:hypothetical protein
VEILTGTPPVEDHGAAANHKLLPSSIAMRPLCVVRSIGKQCLQCDR